MTLDQQIDELSPGERLIVAMPMGEYHARPEVSSGFVRAIDSVGTWTAYHQYITRTLPGRDSDAARCGRIFHHAAPDPSNVRRKVYEVPSSIVDDEILAAIKPEWLGKKGVSLSPGTPINLRSKAHRAYIDGHKAIAAKGGQEWCTEKEDDLQYEQVQSVLDNQETAWLFSNEAAQYEQVGFYRDEKTGIVLKAIADFWQKEYGAGPESNGTAKTRGLIVDFKTTRLHTKDAFIRYAVGPDLRVHVQCAHYCRVFGAEAAAVCAVRNFRPCEAMLYWVPRWRMMEANAAVDMALAKIKECFDMGTWHSEGWSQENWLDLEGERG